MEDKLVDDDVHILYGLYRLCSIASPSVMAVSVMQRGVLSALWPIVALVTHIIVVML